MKQVWIVKRGGPEVFEIREAPDPEPGAGEVRIRVAAAGINFADLLTRLGIYPGAPPLPAVPGFEVAGEIDRLGAGVDGLDVGERVGAMTRFGGYGSMVTVPADAVFRIPDGLSFEKAAAIPVNYATAWFMLVYLGNVRRSERVLVHAAAGGVGQAAVQICRWRGAEIVGSASPSKHERLRQAGVAHCIDSSRSRFHDEVLRVTAGKGVDIALDAVGGKSARESYRCLAPLGRLFLFGLSSFAPGKRRRPLAVIRGMWTTPRFKPLDLISKNRGVFGFHLGCLEGNAGVAREVMGEILARVADGTFEPVVDRTFSFEEAGAAHDYIHSRRSFGKVLLVP